MPFGQRKGNKSQWLKTMDWHTMYIHYCGTFGKLPTLPLHRCRKHSFSMALAAAQYRVPWNISRLGIVRREQINIQFLHHANSLPFNIQEIRQYVNRSSTPYFSTNSRQNSF